MASAGRMMTAFQQRFETPHFVDLSIHERHQRHHRRDERTVVANSLGTTIVRPLKTLAV